MVVVDSIRSAIHILLDYIRLAVCCNFQHILACFDLDIRYICCLPVLLLTSNWQVAGCRMSRESLLCIHACTLDQADNVGQPGCWQQPGCLTADLGTEIADIRCVSGRC
jgi:hypothetical protein